MGSLPSSRDSVNNPADSGDLQTPHVYVEGTWLYGAFAASFLYGIIIVLYVMCFHSLWCRIRSHDGTRKKQWFFLIYVNVVFALNTVFISINSQMTNLGFINNRNYPGGESFRRHSQSVIVDLLSNWHQVPALMNHTHHLQV
jgi:hypothetical protein